VMQRRAVDTITRNAQAQGQLISDILDIQRLASGKLRLNMQQVDLSLAIEAACDTVRPAALAKGVVLSPILDDTPHIPGDPDRIQQVVWNLLSNAVKFSPREGMVIIYLRNLESHVEIVVEDHGPGIKEQFLPYVFERFQQDTAGREKGGMGLGLAIVRHLVELHGGTATATNRVGETGAVVSIRLPKWAIAPAPVVLLPRLNLERVGTPEEAPPSLHGLTVLLVDDEADAREVVATALELCGANVVVATSAAEAVTLLGASRPHVLVCDISMPGRDGYDLLSEIRDLSDAEGGSTPAIALTAMTTTEDRLRALRAGFQFHVPKPVSALELASAIASLAPQRKR
jgi:CheY-like chemotaxis protein